MNSTVTDYCFCTLALGKKYRILAQQLATDLAKYCPKTFIFVYTDNPNDFRFSNNVLAFKHRQQGTLLCYNDKRLVLAKALSKFRAAICIDADTRILADIPDDLQWQPGITVGHSENLVEHAQKYNPERLESLRKLASKLDLPFEKVNYVGESLFVITRDSGKEIEFFNYWGRVGRYLEFQGIHGGEGNAMGLAAAKVGWTIHRDGWQTVKQATQHIDASYMLTPSSSWDKWKLRLSYHYRLNFARLTALNDFEFFYR